MRNEDNDRAFVNGIRSMLDECEAATDERVRMRLRSARLKALDAAEEGVPWYFRSPRLVTVGTFATAAVIAVSIWIVSGQGKLPNGQIEDLEIITSHEQIDMYKDLDFYRWLEHSDQAG